MINFTVGPVVSNPEILEIAMHSTPYFRTPEFSKIMLENEELMLEFLNAPNESKCVFLTTSGTGAMEACVINILNAQDKVIVINGGTFGHRFLELCEVYCLNYIEVRCEFGKQIQSEQLNRLKNQGYTALLVNMNETSSGILYDMQMISQFCKEQRIMLIVDAISSFLADNLDMKQLGASVVMTGSQKALAVQPGISIIALSPDALARVENNKEKCYYLSIKKSLDNMIRGQTPFTPAVTILLQINKRLKCIQKNGGVEAEINKTAYMASVFRKRIKKYPFDFVIENGLDMSNAVTALSPLSCKADEIVRVLKEEYCIWVCPNGGNYSEYVFRVGHLGYLKITDYDRLFEAFDDMIERRII